MNSEGNDVSMGLWCSGIRSMIWKGDPFLPLGGDLGFPKVCMKTYCVHSDKAEWHTEATYFLLSLDILVLFSHRRQLGPGEA